MVRGFVVQKKPRRPKLPKSVFADQVGGEADRAREGTGAGAPGGHRYRDHAEGKSDRPRRGQKGVAYQGSL